jgi:histone H3/H4
MQGARTSDDLDLPKTLVRKIVKNKLLQVDAGGGGGEEARREVQLNKDALLAFSESAKVLHALTALTRDVMLGPVPLAAAPHPAELIPCTFAQVFINCLTATANDICKEQKRQTISADDVFAALQDLELGELVGSLKDALERARCPWNFAIYQSPFCGIAEYPFIGKSAAALLLTAHCSSAFAAALLTARRLPQRQQGEEQAQGGAGQKAQGGGRARARARARARRASAGLCAALRPRSQRPGRAGPGARRRARARAAPAGLRPAVRGRRARGAAALRERRRRAALCRRARRAAADAAVCRAVCGQLPGAVPGDAAPPTHMLTSH